MSDTPTTIDICICTFRREHLALTLQSLAQLERPNNTTIRIIIADNDITPSAQTLASTISDELNLTITYIHAPAQNISIARNACLSAATGDYLAWIDDDEIASPSWLAKLLTTAYTTNADAILGPVHPIYPPSAPAWLRDSNFHTTKPTWVKNQITTGYTGNALLRRNARALQTLTFREEFGITGGEDSDFFTRLHRAGGTIAYAENAVLYETIPQARTTLNWLLRRRFRYGQTHAMLLLATNANRIHHTILASAKATICLLIVPLMLLHPIKKRYWLLRAALHIGTIHGLWKARAHA